MAFSLINIICLFILQFLSGWGVLGIYRIEGTKAVRISLSFIFGIFVCALLPLILEILYIPINLINIYLLFVLLCFLLNRNFKETIFRLKKLFDFALVNIRAYEVLFLLVILVFVLISVWRCYYLPPTPRDVLVGAELLAKYAVEESTIVSSVFTDNIRFSSNNPFKPPYLLNLQIIYKLIGFDFGKIWLSQNVIFFLIFMYSILRQKLHPIIAGFLMIVFMAIPDMYAYSFIMLYDYSNAIFFAIGVYYLQSWFEEERINDLLFAGLSFGVATFIRSESLYFVVLGLPLMWFSVKKQSYVKLIVNSLYVLIPSLLLYSLWHFIFVKFYLPQSYDVLERFNSDFFDFNNLLVIFNEMNSELLFTEKAHAHFAYFLEFFIVLTLINFIFFRDTKGWQVLLWIFILYFGFVLLVHSLPLVEIENTVKRGMFKLFPLALIYLTYNQLLLKSSKWIHSYEYGRSK